MLSPLLVAAEVDGHDLHNAMPITAGAVGRSRVELVVDASRTGDLGGPPCIPLSTLRPAISEVGLNALAAMLDRRV